MQAQPVQITKMEQAEMRAVVAIYNTQTEAETAIREIQKTEFSLAKLSLVGRDYYPKEETIGYYATDDSMKAWGRLGDFWSKMWSLLFGSAFFVIPEIGPILVAGPLVSWILSALQDKSAGGGLNTLRAALSRTGIPQDSIIEYEIQIKAGKLILFAHGLPGDVSKTRAAFATTTHQALNEYVCYA